MSRCYAYTNEDVKCPDLTRQTWKYTEGQGKGWKDAGAGLVVKSPSSSIVVVQGEESITGAKDAQSQIFTTYRIEKDLLNGRVHYTSGDGTKALAYGGGSWRIQSVEKRY